jgi:hypothetical protein
MHQHMNSWSLHINLQYNTFRLEKTEFKVDLK